MSFSFQTKRLVFMPIEKNEMFTEFLYELFKEPGMQNFTHSVPSGHSRAAIDTLIDSLSSSRLLFMAVCTHPREDPVTEPVPMGVISLTKSAERVAHHGTAMLSAIFLERYQRKGYGSEAISWALNWGFDYARLHRVELSVYDWNLDAVRLYKRLGFHEEGVKREALWFKGGWHDMHELAILEGEWRERKSELEQER
ncbi:acyl-CoA N-acyltransferase [Xylariaceae sp. FL0255]|nr:acyl-CoA N-acyltransferase [Xylariaceae sp. FL0255]